MRKRPRELFFTLPADNLIDPRDAQPQTFLDILRVGLRQAVSAALCLMVASPARFLGGAPLSLAASPWRIKHCMYPTGSDVFDRRCVWPAAASHLEYGLSRLLE